MPEYSLGRVRSPRDARDYRLENFLGLGVGERAELTDQELAALAVAELKQTTITYQRWASTRYADVTKTHWWKALDALAKIAPAPTPPSGKVSWQNPEPTLDQGEYGTCVGNGVAQFGNTYPTDDAFIEKDARAIYYEATVLDGWPDDPDAPGGGQQGATCRSGMQAFKNRGRIGTYAMSTNYATLTTWLLSKGPIVVGTDWLANMFEPDANGFVDVSGYVAGGHCYLWLGYDPGADVGEFLNSWGAGWGKNGHFYMHGADIKRLFQSYGEAYTSVELAL